MRAFLPTPVDRATVEELLALASRAPSGTNIQPWKVRVIAGGKRLALSRAIRAAIDRDGMDKYQREWNYYPARPRHRSGYRRPGQGESIGDVPLGGADARLAGAPPRRAATDLYAVVVFFEVRPGSREYDRLVNAA